MTETQEKCIKEKGDVDCSPDERCWDCEKGPKEAKLKHEIDALNNALGNAFEEKRGFFLMCAIPDETGKRATIYEIFDGEAAWGLARIVKSRTEDSLWLLDHNAIKKLQKDLEAKKP